MSQFLTELDVRLVTEKTWRLSSPLVYQSDLAGRIVVPGGFQTDFASVPRIPIIYEAWGNRAHREAIIHDFLYCSDCPVQVSYSTANRIFLEAMACRQKPWHIRYPMFWGVCLGGWPYYHKRTVSGGY